MYDFCVIGGGIVGLATARALLHRCPGARLLLLERESRLASHQTGHNSGVIHSGIYYEPGSLKATLCREGARLTRAYCDERGIPVRKIGKLIVATTDVEVERLAALEARAAQNRIKVVRLSRAEIREREPSVSGSAALFVPSASIVDYQRVTGEIASELAALDADIVLGAEVELIDETTDRVRVRARSGEAWTASRLVVCGGLQADRLARAAGLEPRFQILPFRGEYFVLPPGRDGLIRSMVYPVPDPDLPFLGTHLTPTVDGSVSVGPSAVLGWSRDDYRRHAVHWRDVWTYGSWPGFWRMARSNVRTGLTELIGDWSKSVYLSRCRKYCPELTRADLDRREVGIRAQAVMRDGSFAQDFLFLRTERMLHVGNAPSPAATSAFPIGAHITSALLGA